MPSLPPFRRLAAAVLIAMVLAPAATAETFGVYLGDRPLGTLAIVPPVSGAGTLSTRMTNTPMGLGDGSFDARIDTSGHYESLGRSSRESRRIAVRFEAGHATGAEIEPASEATEMSLPANLPADVVDPVTGLARLTHAAGCPAPFRIFDGRRVVRIGTTGTTRSGDVLTCEIDYRVVAGPGHLSPLRIRSIAITARYALRGGRAAGLVDLSARAGLFELRVAP